MDPENGTAAALELEALTAAYDGPPVVRDVSISVAPGEVVALLGPNGAGKTTTLRAISGLVDPTAGAIRLGGRDVAGMAAVDRVKAGILQVPQDRGIFFGLTVGEHFRLDGIADGENVACTHFPALRPLLGRRAGLMSGGEQQMLAIARVLVRRPKVLLLDELSMGLAPIIVERLLPVVREVADTLGTAVVLVEQHVHLALEVADRAYVMGHGTITLSGTARELRDQPDLLRASYLGTQATAGSAADVPVGRRTA